MDIQTDLEEKKLFFVNSEILRIQIWQKKKVLLTTNWKLQQNSINQIFNPNDFFSLPFDR